MRPDSTRAFFGLAAEQMRRELLDLARHYYGPEGEGANHDSVGRGPTTAARASTPLPRMRRERPGAVDPVP